MTILQPGDAASALQQEVRAKHLPSRKILFSKRHRTLLKLYVHLMRWFGIPVLLVVSIIPSIVILWLYWCRTRVGKLFGIQKPKRDKESILLHPMQDSKEQIQDRRKQDERVDYEHRSEYVMMPDGVRLAVDILLPTHTMGARPCILHQTRYHRSSKMWGVTPYLVGNKNGKPVDWMNLANKQRLLREGYVVVSVDVRGSGASFGRFASCWSHDERVDSGHILNWLVQQPWCNGDVGLYGISYDATNALFTIEKRHPAVKAAVVLYPFLDLFEDVGAPGGARLHAFAENWGAFCESQDANWPAANEKIWQYVLPIVMDGVTPVKGSEHELQDAIAEHHNNWKPGEDLINVRTKDQVLPSGQVSLNHLYLDTESPVQEEHRIPTLLVSGWFDTTARGTIAGFHRATCRSKIPKSGYVVQKVDELLSPNLARQVKRKLSGCGVEQQQQHLEEEKQSVSERFFRLVLGSSCSKDSELLVGPWTHGGTQFVRPGKKPEHGSNKFDEVTMLAEFFAKHLGKQTAQKQQSDSTVLEIDPLPPRLLAPDDQRVQLFMMGTEDWLTFDAWPPKGVAPLCFEFSPVPRDASNFFDVDGMLTSHGESETAAVLDRSEQETESWCYIKEPSSLPQSCPILGQTRWEALTELFTPICYDYSNLVPETATKTLKRSKLVPGTKGKETQKCSKFRGNWVSIVGSPLYESVAVVGQPLVNLTVKLVSTTDTGPDDAQLFVYLLGLKGGDRHAPFYVSEGVLRLSHGAPASDPDDITAGMPSFCDQHGEATKEYRNSLHSHHSDDVSLIPIGTTVDISLRLQPVAYSFAKGDALQIVVAASDSRHFDPVVPRKGVQIGIELCRSSLTLPSLCNEDYEAAKRFVQTSSSSRSKHNNSFSSSNTLQVA